MISLQQGSTARLRADISARYAVMTLGTSEFLYVLYNSLSAYIHFNSLETRMFLALDPYIIVSEQVTCEL